MAPRHQAATRARDPHARARMRCPRRPPSQIWQRAIASAYGGDRRGS